MRSILFRKSLNIEATRNTRVVLSSELDGRDTDPNMTHGNHGETFG